MQGGGGGPGEAAGRREADLGVSSFLTSIRAAGLGSLVARGAGLINNEFTPHTTPPPSCLQGHPALYQLPALGKLSHPCRDLPNSESLGQCGKVDKAKGSLSPISHACF